MKRFLMKCGHIGNAVSNGQPCCAICAGIHSGSFEIEREVQGTDGLEGRKSKCPYCGGITESRWDLPFFEYKPNEKFDGHYDGCFGWD